MGRVRIGTCSGPAEAALVRAALEAHEIRFVINAEAHASMLGGLGGPIVPMHVYVDAGDAEEASALLADLRDEGTADFDDDALAAEAEAAAATADPRDAGPRDAGALDSDDDHDGGLGERIARRRHAGVVLVLALCVTFGTAHMYAGAWLRGFLLALLEIFAITQTIGNPKLGVVLIVASLLTDLIGALVVIQRRPKLPVARVVR